MRSLVPSLGVNCPLSLNCLPWHWPPHSNLNKAGYFIYSSNDEDLSICVMIYLQSHCKIGKMLVWYCQIELCKNKIDWKAFWFNMAKAMTICLLICTHTSRKLGIHILIDVIIANLITALLGNQVQHVIISLSSDVSCFFPQVNGCLSYHRVSHFAVKLVHDAWVTVHWV